MPLRSSQPRTVSVTRFFAALCRARGYRHQLAAATSIEKSATLDCGSYDPYYYDDYSDGYGYPYGYYPYASSDSYAESDGCHVVQRRVHTARGWHRQPVQVCG
jgi:hypothetical protein